MSRSTDPRLLAAARTAAALSCVLALVHGTWVTMQSFYLSQHANRLLLVSARQGTSVSRVVPLYLGLSIPNNFGSKAVVTASTTSGSRSVSFSLAMSDLPPLLPTRIAGHLALAFLLLSCAGGLLLVLWKYPSGRLAAIPAGAAIVLLLIELLVVFPAM